MNGRQRFLETLCGGDPDHPPLFPEGLREDVLETWHAQGLPANTHPEDLFYYDPFEELSPEIYPLPELRDWSDKASVLRKLKQRLDPNDPRRLPRDWERRVEIWQQRQHPLFLRIHQGLFQSLGVEDWRRFEQALLLMVDDPDFVHEVLSIQADFAARLAANILSQVAVDAVVFSEPIAGHSGALVSPRMYCEFALSSYGVIFDTLQRYDVPVVIWRSYGSPHELIPEVARSRFTAIWVCETDPALVDYTRLRRKLGPQLGLIGGIDSDVLRQDQETIRQAVEDVLPLTAQGRYVPLADGRVRAEVPFENYAFYRRTLEALIL